MLPKVRLAVVLLYLSVMLILLGSITFETFGIYPNIFHDPPQSLETGMEFMAVVTPADYFPLLGFLSWVSGAASILLTWRVKPARYWITGSALMIGVEGISSMLFFWPRNEIMFIEGAAVHSDAFLQQTAQEFQRLHWWLRFTPNVLCSVLLFIGFLKLYALMIFSKGTPSETKID